MSVPDGWVELTDADLDRLDLIENNQQIRKHSNLEVRVKAEFRKDGAIDVVTVPQDRCLILGHDWRGLPGMTRLCLTCKLWEAL